MNTRTQLTCLLAALGAASGVMAQNVRISAVYGGGGGGSSFYNSDYVELHNNGAVAESIGTYSIQYASATGNFSGKVNLPVGASIPAGGYYLVQLSAVTAVGANIPAPDLIATSGAGGTGQISASNTSGKIALASTQTLVAGTGCPLPNASILDYVGYGTTATCSETSTAPTFGSQAQVLIRGNGGCTDSNNNNADFTLVTLGVDPYTPRNSSSPLFSCVSVSGADVAVSVADSADCSVLVGQNITYTVTVTNNGPAAATGVAFSMAVPASTTFVSATAPASLSGGNVVATIGNLASGANSTFTVVVTANATGTLTTTANITSTSTDNSPANNSQGVSTLVGSNPVTSATIKGVFSTVASSSSSLVPNFGGFRFDASSSAGGFERLYPSANGQNFIFSARTNYVDPAAPSVDKNQVLYRVLNGVGGVVAIQRGTVLPSGFTPAGFDLFSYGVNNAGQFVFSSTEDGSGGKEVVVVGSAAATPVYTIVARAGDAVPASTGLAGAFYGSTNGSASIQEDGTASFYTTLTGTGSSTAAALLKSSGATLLAQQGVTVPTGQVDASSVATAFPYKNFNFSGASTIPSFYVSGNGATYGTTGFLDTADTSVDQIATVNGAVVIQEGISLPGFLSPANGTSNLRVLPNGDSYLRGANANGQPFVIRNGVVIAQGGSPIATGSTENFGGTGGSAGFFFATGNSCGHTVLGGVTSSTNTLADSVLVLDGTTVVARENDPIDLNGDGVFNDDAYIRFFNQEGFLSDDGKLYVVVELRNYAGQCSGANAFTGQAIIRIDLPAAACNTGNPCPADWNADGEVNGNDISDYINSWYLDIVSGTVIADFNGDGETNGNDISDYINAWYAAIVNGGYCA